MPDDIDFGDFVEEERRRPRDRRIDEAKAVLLARFFPADGANVYYGSAARGAA
jgi:hypothetical protein